MTDTVGLRLLTVTLTHYPPSAANLLTLFKVIVLENERL